MPRINQYTDNTTIENDDKMLTYDTQGAATKLTAFSTIWNWIVSKLHALTSSSAALTPSTDRVLMDKNGTMTRVEPAAVAKYGIETYNGSTIAGSAQTVKSALDALNSNLASYTATQSATTSIASGDSFTNVAHADLEIGGYYLFIANVSFAASQDGARGITLTMGSGADSGWFVNERASNSGSTAMQIVRFQIAVQGATRMNLLVRQTSGSALDCTTRLFAIRLK